MEKDSTFEYVVCTNIIVQEKKIEIWGNEDRVPVLQVAEPGLIPVYVRCFPEHTGGRNPEPLDVAQNKPKTDRNPFVFCHLFEK